jgi:hypothetical protein
MCGGVFSQHLALTASSSIWSGIVIILALTGGQHWRWMKAGATFLRDMNCISVATIPIVASRFFRGNISFAGRSSQDLIRIGINEADVRPQF